MSDAMPAAMAVELFHNFTLMHDDIMDAAPLRRGKETVHIKWDENAAILSGDAMYTLAHIALAQLPAEGLPKALQLFNQTALEVCLGQQSDMAFETRNDVTVAEYMEMIRLKTSVLVAASLALGAIAAGASRQVEQLSSWYRLKPRRGAAPNRRRAPRRPARTCRSGSAARPCSPSPAACPPRSGSRSVASRARAGARPRS